MLYYLHSKSTIFIFIHNRFLDDLSETYKVNGRIIDRETLEPIPFVALHIDKINRYTITDINGEFIFNNLPKGEYEINVSRLGYKKKY